MLKKIFLLFSLILLSNCTTPSSALLGPIFTGAKTGSIYQASISYSSNIVLNKIKEFEKKKSLNKKNIEDFDISTFTRNSILMASYKIDDIQFSEIIEEEPLP
tara:strand:+ start:79 stop:387 length:309 start_codon:yes stop_codon:yes gene_type:complete